MMYVIETPRGKLLEESATTYKGEAWENLFRENPGNHGQIIEDAGKDQDEE